MDSRGNRGDTQEKSNGSSTLNRFDEGELEIGHLATTPALYSTPYFKY